MPNWRELPSAEQCRIATDWLAAFNEALKREQYERVAAMMHADGYWRDLLTFSWDFRTMHGLAEVRAWLSDTFAADPAHDFRLEGEPSVAAMGKHEQTLEFFFTFETKLALGRGHVRLVEDASASGQPRAFTVLTTMQALKAFPERTGRNRPRQGMHAISRSTENGLNKRSATREFNVKDPDVIIVGAGQSGVMLAARLGQLNVSTLLVENSERVGDVWRKRYRSLKLHNDLCMNHFPYLQFPETWPAYLPKDKVADWLEFYAEAMELNVWTGTTFVRGEFDPIEQRWTAQLRLADGGTRIMRPRHMAMAMGVSGLPSMPKLRGMQDFDGVITHSSGPTDDLDVKGKKALVVGAGTSAHDIAHDFYLRGAEVTMLQRSSITVVSLEPSAIRAYQMYRDNDGVRPIADTDMMAAAVPYSLFAQLQGPLSRSMQEADRDLLDGLRKVGFLLDNGEDDTGFFMKLLRYQAGYYLNIGASDLIAEGKIKLKAGIGIERLTPKQVIFTDRSALDVDILVLATGYEPLQEQVRTLFGSEIADRVGPIWGIGDDGELRNMYAPTAQNNFFALGGGFPAARYYSRFTALYIKADLEGLLPARRLQIASSHERRPTAPLQRAEGAPVKG
jgi:cation diffusion facilitator CzcD-associated flavoprotein CzcO